MKKVVAVFHDNNIYSGATKSFLSNVEYLHNKNYEITAVIPRKNGELIEYLRKIGIRTIQANYGGNVYNCSATRFKIIIYFFRCLIKSIISFFSAILTYKKLKKNISVVYSNTSSIYFGYWLSRFLHTHHVWHFREFGEDDQNSRQLFKGYFRRIARKSSIIAISKTLKEYYEKKYNIKGITVLYNDISPSYIIDEKNKHDGINILITGTLCPEKGQLTAIKAIELLNDSKVNLYIAGKINEYATILKKYIDDNNLNNIKLCGLVKDMNHLRKNIDISIVCSKREAFGRTIIEDMLGNILVIGSNSGAVPELINDNENGILYEYNNYNDLAMKIRQVISDMNKYKKIIIEAKKFAIEFTKMTTASEIERILRTI